MVEVSFTIKCFLTYKDQNLIQNQTHNEFSMFLQYLPMLYYTIHYPLGSEHPEFCICCHITQCQRTHLGGDLKLTYLIHCSASAVQNKQNYLVTGNYFFSFKIHFTIYVCVCLLTVYLSTQKILSDSLELKLHNPTWLIKANIRVASRVASS